MDRAERVPHRHRPLNLLRIMPAKGGETMVDSPGAAQLLAGGTRYGVFEGAHPAFNSDLVVEGHGMAPIPEDQRYGSSRRNFTVWFAPNMELSGVFTGTSAFTLGLGLWPGLLAILMGVCLGALPVAFLATLGSQDRNGAAAARPSPFRQEHCSARSRAVAKRDCLGRSRRAVWCRGSAVTVPCPLRARCSHRACTRRSDRIRGL
jgi:hypothetical protein